MACDSSQNALCYFIFQQGFIHVWDVATGVLVRAVTLSEYDSSIFVRQLHVTAGNSVLVCDYGPQLRVVRFTSVLEKDD